MKPVLKMLLNRLLPERKKPLRSDCGNQIRFSHRLTGDEPLRCGTMVQRFDSVSLSSRAIRLLLSATAALAPLTLESASAEAQQAAATKPAAQEDIFLYRGMGSSYLCNARAAKVEFPKAVGIAAATYVQVLNGRHGGKVQAVGDQKLTNEQLLAGAEFQIITGALQYCPDEVPADVKAKVEEAVKKQNAKAGQ